MRYTVIPVQTCAETRALAACPHLDLDAVGRRVLDVDGRHQGAGAGQVDVDEAQQAQRGGHLALKQELEVALPGTCHDAMQRWAMEYVSQSERLRQDSRVNEVWASVITKDMALQDLKVGHLF